MNYSYYTEKDTFTEEDIVYIKKEFCDEYELIKDDNAHDQFLNFSKEKGVIFRRLEENIDDSLIEFSDSSRASKSVIYYYNLNKKDLEKEGNQLESELVSLELKIKDISTSYAGRGKTCSQEANSFNI